MIIMGGKSQFSEAMKQAMKSGSENQSSQGIIHKISSIICIANNGLVAVEIYH
jgi:hypothetical protein